jgi:hypothetical protein
MTCLGPHYPSAGSPTFLPFRHLIVWLSVGWRVSRRRQSVVVVVVSKYIKNMKKEKEKNVPKAQTTHLTSFGPVLVIAAHLCRHQ